MRHCYFLLLFTTPTNRTTCVTYSYNSSQAPDRFLFAQYYCNLLHCYFLYTLVLRSRIQLVRKIFCQLLTSMHIFSRFHFLSYIHLMSIKHCLLSNNLYFYCALWLKIMLFETLRGSTFVFTQWLLLIVFINMQNIRYSGMSRICCVFKMWVHIDFWSFDTDETIKYKHPK